MIPQRTETKFIQIPRICAMITALCTNDAPQNKMTEANRKQTKTWQGRKRKKRQNFFPKEHRG